MIRPANMSDVYEIYKLYKKVAKHNIGNLTQEESEITINYVYKMVKYSLQRGAVFVYIKDKQIVGYIKAFTSEFKCLAHVLSDATLMVEPDYQTKHGIGGKLAIYFLRYVEKNMSHIMKMEIVPHEHNSSAIQIYEKLGFQCIYVNQQKIANKQGFECEVIMTWNNKSFTDAALHNYQMYLLNLQKIQHYKELFIKYVIRTRAYLVNLFKKNTNGFFWNIAVR